MEYVVPHIGEKIMDGWKNFVVMLTGVLVAVILSIYLSK